MQDASQVLVEGQAAMQSVAAADEGALLSASRCYFSLQGSSGHDVAPYLRCGPILFPWSSPSAPWLTYELSGKPTSSGVKVLLGSSVPPTRRASIGARCSGGPMVRRPPMAAAVWRCPRCPANAEGGPASSPPRLLASDRLPLAT